MAFELASRLRGVSESATLALNAAVQTLKTQGVPVINLTAGEPDFNVDDCAKDAVKKALAENKNKYTPVAGIPELRALIAQKTNAAQPTIKAPWKASDVVVTNGGKQALFNAVLALINPGDEVLIPAPYWLSYPEMVKLAGGVPIILETQFKNGFKLAPEILKNAIGPKTKMVIFNSPSNPTGILYSESELKALGQVISGEISHPTTGSAHKNEQLDFWILSDEIYDEIVFKPKDFCSFLRACPELQSRTLTFNGMSKSAAMTGWRVGWVVGPKIAIDGISILQGQSTSGVNALAQWASVAVLSQLLPLGGSGSTDDGPLRRVFDTRREIYQKRRDLALEILAGQSRIEVVVPDGAFYLFVGVSAVLKSGEDSMGFAQRFLTDQKVAVVPGTPFGAAHCLRLSFATDEKSIQEGCSRLVNYC